MKIFRIFTGLIVLTLFSFKGCSQERTRKSSSKVESIVKYIDSLDINRFKGWSANYQFENMQTHYLRDESNEIKSSYNYFFENDLKRLRITPGTFNFFLEMIGYNLPIHKEYTFLIFELRKDSIIVKGKDVNGIENQLDSFKTDKISSKFKKSKIFEKVNEVQKITSYIQGNWGFNPKYKYWRFIIPEGQLIYFPEKENITKKNISGCEKISSKWYLYRKK